MTVSYLEGFGFITIIALCGAIGYLSAGSLKQFFEDRDEPAWLTPLTYVLTTTGICGGAVLAVFAAVQHW